jgi:hypothetical protein
MCEWMSRGRRVAGLFFLAIALIVSAVAAALVVDAIEVLAPPIVSGTQCPPSAHLAAFAGHGPDAGECQWARVAAKRHGARTVALRIAQASGHGLKVTAVVTASSSDLITRMVRSGAAREDPDEFIENIVGSVLVDGLPVEWAPPVTEGRTSRRGTAAISDSGAELPASLGGSTGTEPATVTATLNIPGTVQVTAQSQVIAGIRGTKSVTRQGAHFVTAPISSDQTLTVNMANDAVQPLSAGGPALTWPGQLTRPLSALWRVLEGVFEALFLSAVPWLAIFLAARTRHFGSLGSRAPWQRMSRMIGLVLVADVVISSALVLGNQEQQTITAILPQSFSDAMRDTGLWRPAGYIAVNGSAVLLIALTVYAAGSFARPPASRRDGGRRWHAWLSALGIAAGIGGFIELVRAWDHANGAPVALGPAVELPVTAVLALICLVLGAAWISATAAARLPLLRAGSLLPGRHAWVRGLAAGGLLAAAGVLIVFGITAVLAGHLGFPGPAGPPPPPPPQGPVGSTGSAAGQGFSLLWILLTAVAVAVLGVAVWAGRLWEIPRWFRPAGLAAIIAVMAVAATTILDRGYVPVILRWGVLLAAGTAAGVAVARLVNAGVSERPLEGKWLLAIVPGAAVVAVPWGDLRIPAVISGWWDFVSLAAGAKGLLGLALVAAGCVALRELGSAPVTVETEVRDHRALGVAAWLIALSGTYTLFGPSDSAALLALAVAALGAWLLLPAAQTARAAAVLQQSRKGQARAIRRTLHAGAGRRVLPALSRAAREKVASGDLTLADAQQKIAAVERKSAAAYAEITVSGEVVRVATEQRGFGMLASSCPWSRARWGVLAGTGIGAPWVILGLAGTSLRTGQQPYPELALATAVAPLVIRWAAYGLLFGYFFPLLRGRTGLGKALWLAVAAASPGICATLAAGNATARQWDKAALLVVQIFAFAMTLGILADRAVLREYGLPAARLVDLHNLWTVSAWASSVAVAVATGTATAIIVGLQPFVIGVITPSTAAQPPAATSHR